MIYTGEQVEKIKERVKIAGEIMSCGFAIDIIEVFEAYAVEQDIKLPDEFIGFMQGTKDNLKIMQQRAEDEQN